MAKRITKTAEEQRLLPEGQMGNRQGRSTELAIRVVTEAVYTGWRYNAVTSLLQLDIKGAFDTINHTRLIDTLARQGFPAWVLGWIRSYLSERTARLRFDDAEAPPKSLCAGVPQGSPLSPILFLLYITTLYSALEATELRVVGFSDDTNLLAVSPNPAMNVKRLEQAWEVCQEWARRNGMEFAPEKSELMHFTRANAPGEAASSPRRRHDSAAGVCEIPRCLARPKTTVDSPPQGNQGKDGNAAIRPDQNRCIHVGS